MRNLLPLLLLSLTLTSTSFAAEKFAEPIDVSFTAESDGTTQKYVVLLPDDFDHQQTYSVMIALHGHGSDRWQFIDSDRDECRSARDVALKYNMLFVSPDYRAKTSWMGPAAESDLVQIIKELKSKYQLNHTILVGGSMGGSSSLSFCAMHPELIDAIGSMNGTANHLEYEKFQEFIQASFGGTKQQIPAEYKKRSAEYWPERFTMPLALTTGGQDTVVPPHSCLRLAKIVKKINPHVLLIHRPEGGHSTTYEDAVKILVFLCETLEK
jgi:pimeloyl-ACP methyl ester carboxylesterase